MMITDDPSIGCIRVMWSKLTISVFFQGNTDQFGHHFDPLRGDTFVA
jgi:hypothetical protein